jgi:subtilase family serine protease
MSRSRRLVSLAAATATATAMTVVAVSGPAAAAPRPGYLRLPGSAVPFIGHTRPTGAVAGSVRLTIQVWLRPGHLAAAQRYAAAVSTPGSTLFHHYLSPAAYTARFGASRAAAGAVESWLRRRGFTGVRADAQRNYVRATGPVAAIDAAFQTRLENYQSSAGVNAGPYQLHANNRPLTIPRSLSRYLLGVTGLDNAAPRHPLTLSPAHRRGTAGPAVPCSRYYGQHQIAGLPRQFGRTSFPTPVCGYSAGQLRAAYGASMRNDGRRQTVALVEWGLTRDMFLTLQDYARSDHLVAPSPHRYRELSLGKNTCGDPYNLEEQTDVEASYDMAPGANQLVVGGDSCNNGDFGFQALFDADIAVIDGTAASHHHPLASISSNSWGPGTDAQSPILTSIMHAYLVRAAAQGVGMYFASGDRSGVETPDDPFAVLVGGTSLGIGRHGQRLFETGWSTGLSQLDHARTGWGPPFEAGGTSGGPSLIWTQPAYQRGVVPTALAKSPGGDRPRVLLRSEPDIAADADTFTGFAFGYLVFPKSQPPKFTERTGGGTSIAAPLVAGMIADAQQGQPTAFGFTNPVLYRLNGTPAVHDILPSTSRTPGLFRGEVCNVAPCPRGLSLLTFDDQDHTMFGYTGQVTLKGYDNMTGIGSPNGQAFINALRRLEG